MPVSPPGSGSYQTPGVYIQEVSSGVRPIVAVGSTTAGFVGVAPASKRAGRSIAAADLKTAVCDNWTEFRSQFFSEATADEPEAAWTQLAHAVYGFFHNGGRRCWVVDMGTDESDTQLAAALDVLGAVDEIAIVAAPGFTSDAHYAKIQAHMDGRHDRMFIADAPVDVDTAVSLSQFNPTSLLTGHGAIAIYVPWLHVADPQPARDADGAAASGQTVTVPPSGYIAGVWARNDAERGVHKAPANEPVTGALGLTHTISDQTQTALNQNNVNAIRYFRDTGYLVWGARVLSSDPEWRYVNVRRLCNMIEESIAESTRWVVFEPNDELLWTALRRDVGAFLMDQWRQGALMGTTPEQAFFVKCDAENNPFDSIRRGRVIIDMGIAPVFPAEFIIFRITQYEAGTDVEVA